MRTIGHEVTAQVVYCKLPTSVVSGKPRTGIKYMLFYDIAQLIPYVYIQQWLCLGFLLVPSNVRLKILGWKFTHEHEHVACGMWHEHFAHNLQLLVEILILGEIS